jgi:hypothetical protein
MAISIFDDKQVMPDEKALSEALGESYKYYQDICKVLKNQYGDLTRDWKHYSKSSGWTLKLLHKKRNILFLGPRKDHFVITFIFGDKATDAVLNCPLPERIKKSLSDSKKFIEGRVVNIEVKSQDEANNVMLLIDIKMKY